MIHIDLEFEILSLLASQVKKYGPYTAIYGENTTCKRVRSEITAKIRSIYCRKIAVLSPFTDEKGTVNDIRFD